MKYGYVLSNSKSDLYSTKLANGKLFNKKIYQILKDHNTDIKQISENQ